MNQIVVLLLIPVAIVAVYIRGLWLGRRVKEFTQLGSEYNLQFKTNLRHFLGLYWPYWIWGRANVLSGALGSHQVEVYDWLITDQNPLNPLKFRTNMFGKRPRGTAINLDRRPMQFGPGNLTLGGSSMFARVEEIRTELDKIKNNNI